MAFLFCVVYMLLNIESFQDVFAMVALMTAAWDILTILITLIVYDLLKRRENAN